MELLVIQVLIFLAYVIFIVNRFGVLPSISDSWYSLPHGSKGLFTLFTWGIGIPMLLYGTLPLFISGTGLCFVGAATQFKMKESYTKVIHFAGAAVGIITPLIYFLWSFGIGLPLFIEVFCTALIMSSSEFKIKLWWIEIAGFVTVVYGLLVCIPQITA